jgi:hypothetical protein
MWEVAVKTLVVEFRHPDTSAPARLPLASARRWRQRAGATGEEQKPNKTARASSCP